MVYCSKTSLMHYFSFPIKRHCASWWIIAETARSSHSRRCSVGPLHSNSWSGARQIKSSRTSHAAGSSAWFKWELLSTGKRNKCRQTALSQQAEEREPASPPTHAHTYTTFSFLHTIITPERKQRRMNVNKGCSSTVRAQTLHHSGTEAADGGYLAAFKIQRNLFGSAGIDHMMSCSVSHI